MTKIDLFKDKEYEGFDWLNKAVEPTLFPMNEKFAQLPKERSFTIEELLNMVGVGWNYYDPGVEKDFLISTVAREVGLELTREEVGEMSKLFELSFRPITFNINSIPADEVVKLIKIKDQIEDHEIREMVAIQCRNILYCISNRADVGRMNEVMDLLGCKENRKSRSVNYKSHSIAECYRSILVEDKWRIRNMELAVKMAKWMKHYMEDGNLASMSNFIKVKCMTHSGDPIYSVQETV